MKEQNRALSRFRLFVIKIRKNLENVYVSAGIVCKVLASYLRKVNNLPINACSRRTIVFDICCDYLNWPEFFRIH